MRFNLNGNGAYVIECSEDGCYIWNGRGFYMEAEQMLELGKKLIATAKKKGISQEIIEYNRQHEIEEQQSWGRYKNEPKPKKPKRKSQVYLMECGGKYKIGTSVNVDERRKQLDNRPFPVEIVAVSPFLEEAYIFEAELHEFFKNFKIDGEWFDLSAKEVKRITNLLRRADEIHY